jgi:hypothetical protein
MSDTDRTNLIATMGDSIGTIDQAIKRKDLPTAKVAFVNFVAAVGVLAMELLELDNAVAN